VELEHKLLSCGVELLHQTALSTSGSVWMNDALSGGLIDALDSETEIVVGAGVHRVLHTGTKFTLDRLVAFCTLGVGDDALFLALDVCHVEQG
jgi:hypothetical protein